MKTILITGGTGLLGMRISFLLTEQGMHVRHLSRTENLKATYPAYKWDLDAQTIDPKALENVDGIIHLAGAGIADARWTKSRKKEILKSRIDSSRLLTKALSERKDQPEVFVACSAVGYYGNRKEEVLDENASSGTGFMSEVCVKWEQSVEGIRAMGIRTPIIRVGIVLSTQGGALPKLNMTYPFRIGSYFGNGQQYYPWIHLDDICQIFIKALQKETMTGIYNGTAPIPTTNKNLAQALAKAHDQKTLLVPAPPCAIKMLLGEMSAVVLNSTRAIPQALQKMQHDFQFPDLVPALEDLFKRKI
ncbi:MULTISPECIES: TIGR01777 family oxidoreductase [unclassified Aureispira]|uniref:TIGR01777 family oxidoreductase n=1 Tax=unclassified Aureispira TaxID=2649989 RepID=UPI000696B3E2|nr:MULTISPECIES: TIGR01777 family oxidoreductase [unclassified Aureispira]WMX14093.1 TIGR01777 family oxidoreductase [Aureispira sp. CCB-E]